MYVLSPFVYVLNPVHILTLSIQAVRGLLACGIHKIKKCQYGLKEFLFCTDEGTFSHFWIYLFERVFVRETVQREPYRQTLLPGWMA